MTKTVISVKDKSGVDYSIIIKNSMNELSLYGLYSSNKILLNIEYDLIVYDNEYDLFFVNKFFKNMNKERTRIFKSGKFVTDWHDNFLYTNIKDVLIVHDYIYDEHLYNLISLSDYKIVYEEWKNSKEYIFDDYI